MNRIEFRKTVERLKHGPSTAAGITLTETLIVTGLLAVVGILLVSNLPARTPRFRVERTALDWAYSLRAARMRAVSECLPVYVTVDLAATQLIVEADSNTNGVIEAEERTVAVSPNVPGLDVSANYTNGSFGSRGTWNAANALVISIGVTNVARREIRVLPSGPVSCEIVSP